MFVISKELCFLKLQLVQQWYVLLSIAQPSIVVCCAPFLSDG